MNRKKPAEIKLADNIKIKNIKPIKTVIVKPRISKIEKPNTAKEKGKKKRGNAKIPDIQKLVSVRQSTPRTDILTYGRVEPISKAKKR
ncbi:MAG: hypothetical protein HKN25_14875 [Pyrinomonadaceae bacterium]|nr:hypothetical protein [Pyrinomonadaceae bacterium]